MALATIVILETSALVVQMEVITRIRSWLFNHALPVWTEKCMDSRFGGPVESFSLDGDRPFTDAYKRTFVVARQLYVMSHASLLGEKKAGPLADALFEYLRKVCWRGPESGWVHKVTLEGDILDPTADLYDFAFCLFALSWYYRLTENSDALTLAHQTLDIVERDFAHPSGNGYYNQLPANLPRQQNPHMHLMEGLLAFWEVTNDSRAKDMSNRLAALFQRQLFDKAAGAMPEFFDDFLNPIADSTRNHIEAGHQFEWAWILARHQQLSGQDHTDIVRILVLNAERFGLHETRGWTMNSNKLDTSSQDRGSRTWPNSERIKGWIALHELTGVSPWHAIEQSCETLFGVHLGSSAPRGMWLDTVDEDGKPTCIKIPTSTLYHVFLAFTEVLRIAEGSAPLSSNQDADFNSDSK